ncbi:hypothetical protein C6A85_08280, partial [Mycobacterium sp. ITM-2017-0098]
HVSGAVPVCGRHRGNGVRPGVLAPCDTREQVVEFPHQVGELADLVRELDDLLACVAGGEDTWADAIAAVAPAYRDSARNM